MDDQAKKSSLPDLPTDDEEWLIFLRDEGLEVLALFRSIRDKSERQLIASLVHSIAEAQSVAN